MEKRFPNLRADARPLYARTVDALTEMLEGGALQPGEALPSEEELARQLGVGRSTLREAITGLQEESTYFRTPCLTLRPNTERPVTVTLGSNRLTDVSRLRADLDQVMQNGDRMGQIPPLWDGKTSERILDCLTSQ